MTAHRHEPAAPFSPTCYRHPPSAIRLRLWRPLPVRQDQYSRPTRRRRGIAGRTRKGLLGPPVAGRAHRGRRRETQDEPKAVALDTGNASIRKLVEELRRRLDAYGLRLAAAVFTVWWRAGSV